MGKFVGRENELHLLGDLIKKKTASLVVIKGRRRIGKSRLIEEMGRRFSFDAFYAFSGLPPTKDSTAQSQRDAFAFQLGEYLHIPGIKSEDWLGLFSLLAKKAEQGRILILFDEISWMGSKDPDFLGKLKTAWDLHFKKNDQLIIVLCGSVSTWIEKNILSSTGFVGRITLDLTLKELPLKDCADFWGTFSHQTSAYEKFKVLAITGGIPLYLEHINPKISAEENITALCFRSSGLLYREFENVFSDLFSKRSASYKAILDSLTNGSITQDEICRQIGIKRTGEIGEYLEDLIESGFVAREYTWHLKTGKASKLSHYRIIDNYARFYLKYVEPSRHKIEHDQLLARNISALPKWNGIMGLQFETLVLNNRKEIWRLLGIPPEDIVFDNPYFQNAVKSHPACQIDYLIQTRFNTVYVCEIKFSQKEVGHSVIQEVQEKIKRLALPKHFSYRPVLILVNGVTEDLEESEFFSKIIDFGQFLQ